MAEVPSRRPHPRQRPDDVTVVDRPHEEVDLVRPGDHPVAHETPDDWGWHGEMGRWGRRLWILPFAVILAYLLTYVFGPHEDRAADPWLIGIAVLMILVVLVDRRRRKNAWRAK